MKKIAIAIAGALTLGAAATAQAQSDGTITFNGEVLATSCVIEAGGTTGADATVELPKVAQNSLKADGARIGDTPFSIKIGSAASPCTQNNVQAYFHNRGNVNAAGRLNNEPTGAANVNVVLLNSDHDVINLSNNTNSKIVPIVSGEAQLDFFGQYYATGAAGAGTVKTGVEYSIVYP
ncbi:fimbrial protein [Ralstonia sp. 24A2]|uniref:fimbrial protein n=1 Tax=Ralstonia sp. 24A2 TaxID=3447364 RepID=UPI003F69EAA9